MTEEKAPKTGIAEDLGDNIRRILAPNASPMTYWGTNTYLVGQQDLLVIDPGPDMSEHLDAILNAVLPGQRIAKIVVTHSHLDHSPLAARLHAETGAQVYAFGDALAGRSAIMTELSERGFLGGGEGVDQAFTPHVCVKHGDVIETSEVQLEVLHTPGHFGNHISLAYGDICFTGDHIMGWASSLVSPPDGDLTDFMAACHMLAKRTWRRFHAGHGLPIEAPNDRLVWLIAHRQSREAEILSALKENSDTATGLASRIYTDVNPALLPMAARNVFAHLVDLAGRGLVETTQEIEFNKPFRLS